MDFFKSVFSDDPPPSDSETRVASHSEHQEQHDPHPKPSPAPNPGVSSIANAWTFGSSLLKNIASRSESVIETYRRDLEEFGSGLKKETATIRDVASRAVKDLPTSLEAGAAVAQESLESVGQAIDNLGNTMSDIIAQGKESILAPDSDSESSDARQFVSDQNNINSNSKPYSRFESQIRSIQCDMNTYCEEPEDTGEYDQWKLGFSADEKGEEIEKLIEENGAIEEIYNTIVPGKVDRETFWARYFYRVYKVAKTEEARAKLVKRAISGEEEEDLSWDVDDDDYQESEGFELKNDTKQVIEEKPLKREDEKSALESEGKNLEGENDGKRVEKSVVEREVKSLGGENDGKGVEKSVVEREVKSLGGENDGKGVVSESKIENVVDEKVPSDDSELSGSKLEVKSDEKSGSEGKADNGGSCKDSDFSIVSSHPSLHEEEDLGWDEIEDIGNNDEIKATSSGSPNRVDFRKRLSAAEEEEDLSWDIEDDDEPVKS